MQDHLNKLQLLRTLFDHADNRIVEVNHETNLIHFKQSFNQVQKEELTSINQKIEEFRDLKVPHDFYTCINGLFSPELSNKQIYQVLVMTHLCMPLPSIDDVK
jgi:hypothetical protein